MKKIISIVLVLTMLISLVACGQKSNDSAVENKSKEATSEIDDKKDNLVAENTEGKTKLTLACFVLMPHIEEKITEFNSTNEDYYIEVIDYSQYNTKDDFSAGRTKLNTDIIGGNRPDIIELGKTPVEIYSNKGLMEDLNNFLEKDADLNKDSFVKGAYNALLTGDKLYRLAPTFTITSLYGRKSIIGERSSWDLSQLQSFLKENNNIKLPFINMPQGQILHSLTMYSMDQFVDMENKKCNFDSKEFTSLLETVKQYSETSQEGYKEVNEELLANKGLLATMYLTNIDFFARKESELNGDISVIGFPTASGSGNVAEYAFSFGIFSDSENKDGAWEFLKSYFKEDYQNGLADMEIPVLLKSYNNALDKSEASEEQKQKFNDIINSLTKSSYFDGTLMEIISDEAKQYFEGQRTAEEVAKAIQGRANIYISESR